MEKVSGTEHPPIAISLWGRCLSTYDFGEDWPFPHLLRESGLNIVPIEAEAAEYYVAIDHFSKPLKSVAARIPRNNRLLFALEPRAVSPAQYTMRVRQEYGTTVVQSRRQTLSPHDVVKNFGPLGAETIVRRANRIHQVGIVNENKFSFVQGNLYKTRINYVKSLCAEGVEVRLAGKNWDRNIWWQIKHQIFAFGVCILAKSKLEFRSATLPLRKIKNLHLAGRVESAVEFLSACEFALVIENDPDYVSEKLFNAVEAGCVPLYLGPPLAEFGIPPEIAVPLNGTRNDALNSILYLSESAKSAILEAGKLWLESDTTRCEWAHLTALNGMVAEIKKMTQNS